MKKRYSKRRFELEEFESEDKLRKSLSKRTDAPQRHNRNWKRMTDTGWLAVVGAAMVSLFCVATYCALQIG